MKVDFVSRVFKVRLDPIQAGYLKSHADQRGITSDTLFNLLIKTILNDNLINAVLDDKENPGEVAHGKAGSSSLPRLPAATTSGGSDGGRKADSSGEPRGPAKDGGPDRSHGSGG